MANYYCLMAGLPDLSLDDCKAGPSVMDLKEELDGVLTPADKKLVYYFFLKYDCQNLVRLLKDPEAEIDPRGNFTAEQYTDLMTSARELNFNVHRYPSFMSIFVRNYKYNSEMSGFFAEDAMALDYYRYAMTCPNRILSEWFAFNLDVTNVLTALIARKYGWNVADYIQGDGEVCEMIRQNANARDFDLTCEYDFMADVMRIAECADPVQKERRADELKWQWWEERTFMEPFSIEALVAYLAKREMTDRWARLDVETGRAHFRQIIDNLRAEAQVPQEFAINR